MEHPALFVDDQPLDAGASFNFEPIIATLRSFIVSAPADAPLNICITGGWGSGKTTLLRGLETKFATASATSAAASVPGTKYVPVWFDPWKLSSETEIRNALARAVLDAIERDAGFATNIDMALDRKSVMRVLGDRLFRVNPDDVSAMYRVDAKTQETFVEVEQLFRRITEVYLSDPEQPRKLIVFVDDLDRCRPAMITSVLESIKLFFDFPGLIFVFAVDWSQLERAAMADYDFSHGEARVYLEKVFQLTVPLPRKPAPDVQEFLGATLKDIGVELADEGLTTAIVDRFGRNLRRLKLFVNTASFQYRLIDGTQDLSTEPPFKEALFKWLYLESTMNQSMTVGLRDGSLGLVLSLEFLAHGGFLHDPELQSEYARRLHSNDLNYPALICYSIIAEQAQEELEQRRSTYLTSEQQAIVDALQADGAVASTLRVLREGTQRLAEGELTRMIYLTRQEAVGDADDLAQDPHEDHHAMFSRGNPLSARDWNRLGDALGDEKGDLANSYLAYLMAVMMEPSRAIYIADLARSLGKVEKFGAARRLFSTAYEREPTNPYILVELALMYDIELRNKVQLCNGEKMANVVYRKALAHGNRSSTAPYNLSQNLNRDGQFEEAYFAGLDACVKDRDDEQKQARLIKYAQDAGFSERTALRPHEELEQELRAVIAAGNYPPPFTDEDEAMIQAALMHNRDDEAEATELSRPPF